MRSDDRRVATSSLGPILDRRLDRPTTRVIQLWAGLLGLLLVWWMFGSLLMPALIRQVHAGLDLPLLSRIMAGRDTTPLELYLDTWNGISEGIGLLLVLSLILSISCALAVPALAERLEALEDRAGLPRDASAALWTGLMLLLLATVWALAHLSPVGYVYAITEDYWVEHGTFLAFLMAGLLFLWAAVLSPRYRTLGPLAFAFVAVLVGLEEVSWGQRILGFETPEIVHVHNWQGEMTLHNIWFPRNAVVGAVVILFGVVLPPLVNRVGGLQGLFERFAVPIPTRAEGPLFLLAGLLLISSRHVPVYFEMEEVAELVLGVAVLAVALRMTLRAGSRNDREIRRSVIPAGATMGVLTAATALLVHQAPSLEELRWRMNDMAVERYPAVGMHEQAEVLFRYMDGNPELQLPFTRVEHGRILVELGEVERSRSVLQRAYETQEARLATTPEVFSEARRYQGIIYTLLGESHLAEAAFQESVSADQTLLLEAGSDNERGWIEWSLAQTMEGRGDLESALEHGARACTLSDDRLLHRIIERWASRRVEDPEEIPEDCRVRT